MSLGGLSRYLPAGPSYLTAHSFDKSRHHTLLNASRIVNTLITRFFSPLTAIASKPTISLASDLVTIHIPYYSHVPNAALNSNTINSLGEALSHTFNRPTELRLIRLNHPYLDAHILAQWISQEILDTTFDKVVKRVFASVAPLKDLNAVGGSKLPSHVVGLKVQLHGRLTMEASRPRVTEQSATMGTFRSDRMGLVQSAGYTNTNPKGAYTVKVWLSQAATGRAVAMEGR
jgi:ribosomal protein S3